MSRDLLGVIVAFALPLAFLAILYRLYRGPLTHIGVRATPDRPARFGYKCGWLAVRASSVDEVVLALGPKRRTPCNWATGIGRVYGNIGNEDVFVTPPVDGWVFVVGGRLDDVSRLDTVARLSRVLDREVFGFATHRGVSYAAWVRAERGEIVRAWAIVDGKRIYDRGPVTEAERALDISFDEEPSEEDDERWERQSHESTVIALSGTWTRDPTTLDEVEELGVGVLVTVGRRG